MPLVDAMYILHEKTAGVASKSSSKKSSKIISSLAILNNQIPLLVAIMILSFTISGVLIEIPICFLKIISGVGKVDLLLGPLAILEDSFLCLTKYKYPFNPTIAAILSLEL